jgi:3-dehydroquinate dehydratase I
VECEGGLQQRLLTGTQHGIPVILAFHDFQATPSSECLLAKLDAMRDAGADVAKLAVMPRNADDVMRLLQATAQVRRAFPDLPLSIMAMGALGSITRVAGFLYGSCATHCGAVVAVLLTS